MKKFKFSLEKVLKHRAILVDLAKKDFAEAQAEVVLETEKLNTLINDKQQAFENRSARIEQGNGWVNEVEQINLFLTGQDLRIKKQNLCLKKAENLVESRREILRQAISQVKILERLAEKQKTQFLEELTKAEQAEIDDLVGIRYVTKGMHEDGI